MTQFDVTYKLYNSAGTGLIYTFPIVQSDNSPQDPQHYVEFESLRGTGSVIIPGSSSAWDLKISFIFVSDDYEELIAKMDTLESTIVKNTQYVLKIDRTSAGATKSYNVKRIVPFEFDSGEFRTDYQVVTATFRVNSW